MMLFKDGKKQTWAEKTLLSHASSNVEFKATFQRSSRIFTLLKMDTTLIPSLHGLRLSKKQG